MATVIKTTFQLKRGTAARWVEVNPILALAEPGFEVDTGKLKIGDGVKAWLELEYIGDDKIFSCPAITDLPAEGKVEYLYRVIEEKALYQWANGQYEKISVGEAELEEVKASIQEAKEEIAALKKADEEILKSIASDEKFAVSNLPVGSLVTQNDEEIRIMCPENAEWQLQNVGANGNPNMYYMTFKAYAPEDAESFKEGDRGVIVDEEIFFDSSSAGIDEFGRKYSVCWLALALYTPSTDTWSYFGKDSTAKKYIGWDYVVEWYDKDKVKIGYDNIRINLSNESCHYNSLPYYMNNINYNSLTQTAGEFLELYGGSATDNIKLEG